MPDKKIIKVENQRSSIEWTSFKAISYAEGFCEGENATLEEQMEAWSILIKSGQCWTLQGWFGRQANDLIEGGIITREGKINWNNLK